MKNLKKQQKNKQTNKQTNKQKLKSQAASLLKFDHNLIFYKNSDNSWEQFGEKTLSRQTHKGINKRMDGRYIIEPSLRGSNIINIEDATNTE